jgi:hypothetical protein
MLVVRALLALMLRVAAALVIVSLGAGPAPLAAAVGGHCAGHHQHRHGYGPTVRHSDVAVETIGAGAPAECPHCASADCAFQAPCAAGLTAVGAGRMPEIPRAGAVGAAADGAAGDARSLALTPPTPPPLAIP